MHNPADNTPIVHSLNTAHVYRQMRLNPLPLLIAQPKEILAHDPDPLPKSNQDRIVTAQELMSSDPSTSCLAVVNRNGSDNDSFRVLAA